MDGVHPHAELAAEAAEATAEQDAFFVIARDHRLEGSALGRRRLVRGRLRAGIEHR